MEFQNEPVVCSPVVLTENGLIRGHFAGGGPPRVGSEVVRAGRLRYPGRERGGPGHPIAGKAMAGVGMGLLIRAGAAAGCLVLGALAVSYWAAPSLRRADRVPAPATPAKVE